MNIKKEYLYMTETAPGKAQAIERLVQIVALLRSECPWDKVQTHQTLRQGMIEEASKFDLTDVINEEC